MIRVLAGVAIAAIIALVIGYVMSQRYQKARAADQNRIADLQQQLNRLQVQNTQLSADLAKVQHEEERLSAANQELSKAIAQARLTGKIPPLPEAALPYPP